VQGRGGFDSLRKNRGYKVENRKLQKVRQGMGINNDLMAWALPEGAIARFGRAE